MIPYGLIEELSKYKDFIFFCQECGFRTMMDRGKHFQCQNTTGENGIESCGVDYEYPGCRFKEPEKFDLWRQKMIHKLTHLKSDYSNYQT